MKRPILAFLAASSPTLALVLVLSCWTSSCTSSRGVGVGPADAGVQPDSSGAGGVATGTGGRDAGSGGSGGAAGAPRNDAAAIDDAPATSDGPAATAETAPVRPAKALLYIFSNLYFRHPSIEPAANTLQSALQALGYTVVISKDQSVFSTAGLADFTLVVMIGSCGSPLGDPETSSVAALDAWLKAGGAFVGIHAASAVSYADTSRFVQIMGGNFNGHPGDIRPDACVPQGTHPSVVNLPNPFNVRDEIYTFRGYNQANQVDLRCPALDGTLLPIAWHRTEGLGRVFYTALGHDIELWTTDSPLVKDHVLPGILWAAGR